MRLALSDERWPDGAADAQGAPEDGGKNTETSRDGITCLERTDMSGSSFESEHILHDALSAACDTKPADVEAREHAFEHTWRPAAEGLYDLSLEKDSCGVGFIANIKGKKSHQIVSDAISILCNLEHRGAVGADPRAGDGAGILVQIPHAFFAR